MKQNTERWVKRKWSWEQGKGWKGGGFYERRENQAERRKKNSLKLHFSLFLLQILFIFQQLVEKDVFRDALQEEDVWGRSEQGKDERDWGRSSGSLLVVGFELWIWLEAIFGLFQSCFWSKTGLLGLIEAGGWAGDLAKFIWSQILKVERILQTCLHPSRLETRAKELIASERKRE